MAAATQSPESPRRTDTSPFSRLTRATPRPVSVVGILCANRCGHSGRQQDGTRQSQKPENRQASHDWVSRTTHRDAARSGPNSKYFWFNQLYAAIEIGFWLKTTTHGCDESLDGCRLDQGNQEEHESGHRRGIRISSVHRIHCLETARIPKATAHGIQNQMGATASARPRLQPARFQFGVRNANRHRAEANPRPGPSRRPGSTPDIGREEGTTSSSSTGDRRTKDKASLQARRGAAA